MPQFRKKPVVIEAREFGAEPDVHLLTWINEGQKAIRRPIARWRADGGGPHLIIPTLEGNHRAEPGDWIIRGVAGEHYPCKPDIFEATYEPVSDLSTAVEG